MRLSTAHRFAKKKTQTKKKFKNFLTKFSGKKCLQNKM